jgi:amino acid transporter
VGTAFGPFAGFIAGVLLWMLGTFAGAAVATVFASSVGLLVSDLSGRTTEIAILIGAFAFWCVINLRGVSLGSQLNSVATVAKLAPLLLIGIGGLLFIDAGHLAWTEPPSIAAVARTSLLLIFAFAGLEVALVPSGEVQNTERTVPRAIALAMAGITALYIALQISAQGILGAQLAQASVSPLADAAGTAFGGWGRTVLLTGASISMFGYLGGMTLSVPRMLYAFARDGFLPRAFAAVDATHHVPRLAIVSQSALVVVLAISGTFERLAVLANVSALALYFGCALAAWRLHRRSIVPVLTCLVILWLLTGLTLQEWAGFGISVAAAAAVYAVTAQSRRTNGARGMKDVLRDLS